MASSDVFCRRSSLGYGEARFERIDQPHARSTVACIAPGPGVRRRSGAGRARPDLFLPGARRSRARAGRPGVGAARAAGDDRRGLGRPCRGRAAPAQPHEGGRGQARSSAARSRSCASSSIGSRTIRSPARHGAAHGAAHGRASRPRARARRRAACRAGAAAHDGGAPARAGAARRRPGARQERGQRRTPASRSA